jgi:DNA polymerase-3 subunit alpha
VLYLKIEQDKQDEKSLQQLNRLLKENRGNTSVVLHYEAIRKTVRLATENNINPNAELLKKLNDFLGSNNVVLKE